MSETFHILEPSYDAMSSIARFPYRLGDLTFTEILTFPAGARTDAVAAPAFTRLLRLAAVVLGTSYYKLRSPLAIEAAFPLSPEERDFALDVYGNGLGEFYARNNLQRFGRITLTASGELPAAIPPATLTDRILLPIGGGKDSLVSVQLLERAGIDFTPFAVNPKGPILGSVGKIGRTPLYIERKLDPEMIRLGQLPGYYNGHVPSTAINATIAALSAWLFDYAAIAFSNERSASEGNAIHDGREVNHQYSKSIDFEATIGAVLATATGGALSCFSLLRPFSEARIAALFVREQRFDHVFSSCNRNFKLSGHDGPLWCGECPKCHFTFLMMAPHISRERMLGIFGADFLDNPTNERSFRELTGLAGQKPWECVGEIEEAAACLQLLTTRPEWQNTAIVRALREPLIEQYGASRLEAALAALFVDSPEHRIPPAIAERIAPHAV